MCWRSPASSPNRSTCRKSRSWEAPRGLAAFASRTKTRGFGYVPPVEYLTEQEIHPRVLVETGPRSGSVPGAQVLVLGNTHCEEPMTCSVTVLLTQFARAGQHPFILVHW